MKKSVIVLLTGVSLFFAQSARAGDFARSASDVEFGNALGGWHIQAGAKGPLIASGLGSGKEIGEAVKRAKSAGTRVYFTDGWLRKLNSSFSPDIDVERTLKEAEAAELAKAQGQARSAAGVDTKVPNLGIEAAQPAAGIEPTSQSKSLK